MPSTPRKKTPEAPRRRGVYPPFRDLAERTLTDEQRLRVSARVSRPTLEMNLRELRKHLGVTQVELAKLADIARPELSRAERRADHMLSTLRRIVRALGGELELHAKFKDGEDVRLAVGD